MPDAICSYLPMAQTVWYVPTGLDIWNQLLGKAPGHYVRMYKIDVSSAPRRRSCTGPTRSRCISTAPSTSG